MSTSPNTTSPTAPKADFVATRTTIGTTMDARLRILLGWKMRVHVKTPLRVGEEGLVEVTGKSSVAVAEIAPRWWVWLMGKLGIIPLRNQSLSGRAT